MICFDKLKSCNSKIVAMNASRDKRLTQSNDATALPPGSSYLLAVGAGLEACAQAGTDQEDPPDNDEPNEEEWDRN